jgi:uracil-DNA glycosylase family 4
MTSLKEELHEVVLQLKTELEWAARTGIVIDERRVEAKPEAVAKVSASQSGPAPKVQREPVQRASHSGMNEPQAALSSLLSLPAIRTEMGDCRRCKLHEGRQNIVFGVGDPNADLMFIGEGPGADEDRQGEPFVGKAGQLLTKIMGAMGFSRDEIYIANIVKCRPPKNRDPEPDEIEACIGFLKAQVASVKPKVIVCLGRPASQTLLQTSVSITRLRGEWNQFEGIDVMPTFHPSYLLRSPEHKGAVWKDMQAVVTKLGRELPKRTQ